jgi:uncharacterized secreted protein with C-terminal beta-propeller domain
MSRARSLWGAALLICIDCSSGARGPAAVQVPIGTGLGGPAPASAPPPQQPESLEKRIAGDNTPFPPTGKCDPALIQALRVHMSGAVAPPMAEASPAVELVAQSCSDAANALKRRAQVEMRRELERARDQYVLQRCNAPYGRKGKVIVETSDSSVIGAGSAPRETSQTNVQMVGVDEPDFVKNDGKFLYAAAGGKVQIFDVWPPEKAHVVAKLFDLGDARKLLLDEDRLMVLSSIPKADAMLRGSRSPECTYGYDCEFTGDGSATRLTIFDVSDRSAPKRIRQLDLSGSLISARAIGSNVHVVVHDTGLSWRRLGLTSSPHAYPDSPRSTFEAYEALIRENEGIIVGLGPEQFLPVVEEHSAPAGATPPAGTCALHSNGSPDLGFVSIVSTDLREARGFSRIVTSSKPGIVYASPKAMYLAVRESANNGIDWPQTTVVHRFDMVGPATKYAATGVVKGRALNQFALDEYGGDLRIAATSGHLPNPNVHSTLTVLRQKGSKLAEVGKLDHLAFGEDIRSVHFQGDRGFLVTFKKTDPLFVFDLSKPESPQVLGELKVPGFSTYMHFLDPNHLLTVGFDADDQGGFAWFTGVLLQVFDASNPVHPTLLHRAVIGTRGSSSQALNDHLAFNYFAPKQMLLLPMTVCEGDWKGAPGLGKPAKQTFGGLMVYDVSVPGGFRLRHKISHEDVAPKAKPSERGASRVPPESLRACSNWWSQSSSYVKRSIVADDYVFSVSNSEIRISDLRNKWRKLPVLGLR